MSSFRIGYGEDAHRLVIEGATKGAGEGKLVIAGVQVPESPAGVIAHSDGDVVLHALADALLSVFALGDIGYYFPPSDPQWRDLDSQHIVREVYRMIREHTPTAQVVNVAVVVTLDTPKLGKHRDAMRQRVAELLGVVKEEIGLTFKTSEGLAAEHVQARVSLLVTV